MGRTLAILLATFLLVSFIPASPAIAAQPTKVNFNEVMSVQYIGTGTVRQVGNPDGTYCWLVKDRPAGGVITSGNVFSSGTFTFVYSGVFRPDQSGRAEGDLTVVTPTGTATAKVITSVSATTPIGIALKNDAPYGIVARASFTSAHFALVTGTGSYKHLRGAGSFAGDIYAILDMSGTHVIALADGTYPVFGFDNSYLGNPASIMTMTGSGVTR